MIHAALPLIKDSPKSVLCYYSHELDDAVHGGHQRHALKIKSSLLLSMSDHSTQHKHTLAWKDLELILLSQITLIIKYPKFTRALNGIFNKVPS